MAKIHNLKELNKLGRELKNDDYVYFITNNKEMRYSIGSNYLSNLDFGDSYAEWTHVVQKKIDELKNKGIFLTKVNIDPEEFLTWCNINSIIPNKKSRGKFVALSQAKDTGQTH